MSKKALRIRTLKSLIKNRIKRVFGANQTEVEVLPFSYDEKVTDSLSNTIDLCYSFLKDLRPEDRRILLCQIAPEMDEKVIDYVMESISDLEREKLKILTPADIAEENLLKKEEAKKDRNRFFPDLFLE